MALRASLIPAAWLCRTALLCLGLLPVAPAGAAEPLVVYGDSRLPPYEFAEDGQPKGVNIDLWRAIGQKLGRGVEFRLIEWSQAQAEFRAGKGDALSVLGKTPEREAIYDFSQKIYSFRFSLFVRSDAAATFFSRPLASRRIGVTAASYPRLHFETNEPAVPLVIVADTAEGMRRVLRGDIDAFAANRVTGEYFLRELGIGGVRPLEGAFASLDAAIAIHRGDDALLAEIDEALARLKAEGELDRILDRWAGERVVMFSQREIWQMGWAAGAGIAVFVLAVLLFLARRRQHDLARAMAQANALLDERGAALAAANATLRSSESSLRLALDAAAMVAFERAGDGGRLTCHGKAADTLGLAPEGPVAAFIERIHPDDRPLVLATHRDATPESPTHTVEYRLCLADGTYRWLAEHCEAIFDRDRRRVGTHGVLMDITPRKEAELALRHERELLSAIIDNIPIMLCLYDTSLRKFRVNRHFQQVLGWSEADTNAEGFMARLYPDPVKRAAAEDFVRRLDAGWRELECTAKDGGAVPAEWANLALSDDSLVRIGIDLRERRRAEAKLRRQAERRALLLEVASGILQGWGDKADMARIVFDKVKEDLQADVCFSYRVLPEGGGMELVAGLGISEASRRALQRLALGQAFCGLAAATGVFVVADRGRIEADERGIFVRRLGVRAYMAYPLLGLDGQVIGTLSLGSLRRDSFEPEDVDFLQAIAYFLSLAWERRRAEQQIERLNADLERRVRERTAELMAANRELEGFTFATSHDLRGPLGRINSFSALLEKQYRGLLDGDGLLFLDMIRQNAVRLMNLVDDLLSHARIARQEQELGPVEPRALIEAIVREKAEDIRESSAQVHVDLPAMQLMGEPHALHQALGNLIENALKYCDRARPPEVEIGGKCEDGRCRLWVRDNGIGFDMAYHDRIFEMFRRLHTYNEYPGTGVGLALVKRAVERMHGRVWAESAPGEGATFFLELPAVEAVLES